MSSFAVLLLFILNQISNQVFTAKLKLKIPSLQIIRKKIYIFIWNDSCRCHKSKVTNPHLPAIKSFGKRFQV